MPEFHDVVPLRAPRYVNHFGKLLIVMVLFIATQTIWLVQDIQKYHRARRSGLSTSANVFEVVAKPSGEVIICTSTPDGARTSSSRPVWVGKFAECVLSNEHIKMLQKGAEGCFSFDNTVSADVFMGCVVSPLLDPASTLSFRGFYAMPQVDGT